MAIWEPLVDFPDHEICVEYPYEIRRIADGRVKRSHLDNGGYTRYNLNRIAHYHHRLIARQWIPNPNNLPCVDHISRDQTDNHVENLRWVSYSTNNKNKNRTHGNDHVYVDELPEAAIVVDTYGKHRFEDYHYCDDVFYYYNGTQYRILRISTRSRYGRQFVLATDINGMSCEINIAKFKREYNFIMA
jgi:hypothetical protein